MANQYQRMKCLAAAKPPRPCLLGGAALFIIMILSSVIADAIADTFILESGEALEGSIVRATAHTVIIRRATTGGMRQVGRATIREVSVDTRDGEPVVGRLHGWSDGVYEVQSGQEVIRVRDGRILSAATMPAGQDAEPAKPGAGGAAGEAEEPETLVTEPDAEAEAVQSNTAAGGLQGARLEIDGSAAPVVENEAALIFVVKLSRPAEEPVVVLFSTLDGTAIAGQDFEPQQGVITVESGSTAAKLHVRLINDELAEGDEYFELFLSIDPKVAELPASYITATIKDDD